MATLFFLRHARTIMNDEGFWSGVTDCAATEEGLKSAKEGFKPYSNIKFNHFFCSPLRRTIQTLEAILPELPDDADVNIDSRIIERSFGDWEGKPYASVGKDITELCIQGKVQPPNGEPYQDVEKRVISFVEDLFNTYYDKGNILIVSHASVLRMVRDVFLPEMEKGPIKNSQLIIVTENDFADYSRRNEE